MTSEEIKATYSMLDVVGMYGFKPNRNGFILCPFHHETGHASLKIYNNNFHCFGCGADGDIFAFVQNMDGCNFRDAFLKLGGQYGNVSEWRKKRFAYASAKRKESEEIREKRLANDRKKIYDDIKHHKLIVANSEVFSDEWCESTNALERLFLRLEEMERK